MRPVRLVQTDVLDQRDLFQHVTVWIVFVLPATDETDGQTVPNAKKHDNRHHKPLVNLSCELGVFASWVVFTHQFDSEEQETLYLPLIKGV